VLGVGFGSGCNGSYKLDVAGGSGEGELVDVAWGGEG